MKFMGCMHGEIQNMLLSLMHVNLTEGHANEKNVMSGQKRKEKKSQALG